MEREKDNSGVDNFSVDPSSSSVNNLILDYYRKFGRKRDLEQFFSLSTAQSEIRDPAGTFWRKMKSQNDSSDSGEKKSESSDELCRISIKCSIPEPSSCQQQTYEEHQNSDSESPPIVTEEVTPKTCGNSDEESVKSEDAQSQRSNDAVLDSSINKPHSPTSSITSQRKLEWDSLADVGYANESDRKTSASSLSTLERLALNQQYSHNDSKQNVKLGSPTSHSTPVEEIGTQSKGKKGLFKKTTNIYQKDVDLVELNVPHNLQVNFPQAISVNLSKHICFNVEKNGEINIGNIKKDVSVSPDKNIGTTMQTQEKFDKEIQTSLLHNKDKNTSLKNSPKNDSLNIQRFPVLISLNTLRNRKRRRKLRIAKKKLRTRNKFKSDNENISKAKITEQVSEAESFEYMPGHIYNQKHLKINQSRGTHVGNKSSLESSAGLTTDSSKGSKHSFSKDLEKSIDLLKTVLQQNSDDSTLKKKLIKEVVQRLIKSKYRDDESSTDFLSGLSFNSKIIGEANHTTTSTSDANNTGNKTKLYKPKKSILQSTKFNSNAIASTSQSAPNLPSVSNSENLVISNLNKPVFFSNTDSEMSSKEKNSTDIGMTRTSSEEFYKKYLEALKREQAYKKHLKDKENFLKQKLVSSETAIAQLAQADLKTKNKLKSLIKDLTRNIYNDGSGDASKLEGHSSSNMYMDPHIISNNHRSHSVFTLSSGHSDGQNKNPKLKNILKSAIQSSSKASCSKNEHHYCCCPYHMDHAKVGFTDSSVQVNIKCDKPTKQMEIESGLQKCVKCAKFTNESLRNIPKVISDSESGDLKYICVCSNEGVSEKVPQNFLVYKCSRLVNKSVQLGDSLIRNSNTEYEECAKESHSCCDQRNNKPKVTVKQESCMYNIPQNSKSSQTNVNLNLMVQRKSSVKSISSQFSDGTNDANISGSENDNSKLYIQEAIRSIQTDISINPKLSDPCLSDINIIDDNECVKLVKEQFKELSKSNSENNTEAHVSGQKSQLSTGNSSCKVMSKTSVDKTNKMKKSLDYAHIAQLDKEVQSDLGHVDNENFADQFTIPIQGTNMTLKVNLGTTQFDNNKLNNIAIKSQGIVTDKTNVAEQFTSLREDCTKSIQCCNGNLFQQIRQDSAEQNISDKYINTNEKPPTSTNKCAGNTCLVDKQKCNTFPRKEQINARKPLLRTNTDVSNFENPNIPQIDLKKYHNKKNKDSSSDYHEGLTDQPTEYSQSEKCANCYNKKKLMNSTIMSNYQSLSEMCKNCFNQKDSVDQLPEFNGKYQPEKYTGCLYQKNIPDAATNTNNENQSEKCKTCINQKVSKIITPNYQNQPEKCKACSNQKDTTDQPTKINNQNQSEKCVTCSNQKVLIDQLTKPNNPNQTEKCTVCSTKKVIIDQPKQPNNTNHTDKCTACSNQKVLIDQPTKPNHQNQTEKCTACSTKKVLIDQPTKANNQNQTEKCTGCSNPKNLIDQPKKPISQTQPEKCKASPKQRDSTKIDIQNQSKNCTISNYKSERDQLSKSHDQNQSKKCLTCSHQKCITDQPNHFNKQNISKKCVTCSNQKDLFDLPTKSNNQHQSEMYLTCSSKCSKVESASKREEEIKSRTQSNTSACDSDNHLDCYANSDPLLDMIEGITKRYSKKDIERSKRKKCFKEIMKVLNYLLDTEEGNDDQNKKSDNDSFASDLKKDEITKNGSPEIECCPSKTFVDKGVQLSAQSKLNKCCNSESSEVAVTSEFPTTSSDSATCKVLNKIKKECEKYHQKRCKSHNALKACETSSTTSINCEQCKRVHHCYCLRYKCKTHKIKTCGEKPKKKCVAYNLILQTSDSAVSEETVPGNNRPLRSIIVKVPSTRKQAENVPFKEMAAKLRRNLPNCSSRSPCRGYRSKSLPNESEISSTDEFLRKSQTYTVREYLERNRPEFVEKCSRRQDCLKTINETRPEMCSSPYYKMVVVHTPKCVAGSCLDPCNMCYGGVPMPCNQCVDPYMHIQNEVTMIANERNAKRKLLSLQLGKQEALSALTDEELRHFAKQLGEELRRKKIAPKFISEREMKKHSEKIYKSLPEVTRKKDEIKKENMKKTNLLMANIFKKNLQKKTLRGALNLSNYSTVIKI